MVNTARVHEQIEDARRALFEPQLAALGLSEESIRAQTVDQLEESLAKINELVANPGSIGRTTIKVSASGTAVIASAVEAHMEIGALPLLLDRKSKILERLKALKPVEQLNDLRAVVEDVGEPAVRERIERALNDLQQQTNGLAEQIRETELSRQRATTDELEAIKLERFERRARVWQAFLERESVATIVGAVILVVLTGTLVVAMFLGTAPADVLSNAFLLILGYFFGQSTRRSRPDSQSE